MRGSKLIFVIYPAQVALSSTNKKVSAPSGFVSACQLPIDALSHKWLNVSLEVPSLAFESISESAPRPNSWLPQWTCHNSRSTRESRLPSTLQKLSNEQTLPRDFLPKRFSKQATHSLHFLRCGLHRDF